MGQKCETGYWKDIDERQILESNFHICIYGNFIHIYTYIYIKPVNDPHSFEEGRVELCSI